MIDQPQKLETETQEEFDLFMLYLHPENAPIPMRYFKEVCKKSGLSETHIQEIAARNGWQARALNYDLQFIKNRKPPKTNEIVANALIKLAGNTLAGTAPKAVSAEDNITKALKLIEGYRKLQ